MSLHPLDPRHGEPCPTCDGDGRLAIYTDASPPRVYDKPVDCHTCHGTGTVGGAEPEIDVHDLPQYGTWWWTTREREDVLGPFPTEADALFAARCALVGVRIEEVDPGVFDWRGMRDATGYPTRDAALAAALDAR